MIYRDLLKICIYFIAVKLFIDFTSQLPERVYNSIYLKAGSVYINIVMYILINSTIIMLLLSRGGFFVDFVFKKRLEFFKEDYKSSTAIKIGILLCAYYVILNSLFSLIMNVSTFEFNFYASKIFMSIAISLLLIFFSNKISNKFKFFNK